MSDSHWRSLIFTSRGRHTRFDCDWSSDVCSSDLIMRWLPHRGGAIDFREHCEARPVEPFPVAVALGADPATILGAVTPVPDTLSEYQFAGLLRGSRTELANCLGSDLQVPASSEIVLEGSIQPGETAVEGPFGDHTGYYNEKESFPVFTVERVTMRREPIYHSTYTGKPPDEPAVLGAALNEVFVPIVQRSEEHTSELQSQSNLVCRLLLEKKNLNH